MEYCFPFGEKLHKVAQGDHSPKKVFVLGVYASAVHAKWIKDGKILCRALAVASEPRIFWDGNEDEAKELISKIKVPEGLGELVPADKRFNGPSAKVLDEKILAPLNFTRVDVWLCDLLPEARLNPNQVKIIEEKYYTYLDQYDLPKVSVPLRRNNFCDNIRAQEIAEELFDSEASLLILLGDVPIKQFLKRVSGIKYSSLKEYCVKHGYGQVSEIVINGKCFNVLPLAHPRQIGGLGKSNEKWAIAHEKWLQNLLRK